MLVATIRKITNGVFDGTTRKLDVTHRFLKILATLSPYQPLAATVFGLAALPLEGNAVTHFHQQFT